MYYDGKNVATYCTNGNRFSVLAVEPGGKTETIRGCFGDRADFYPADL